LVFEIRREERMMKNLKGTLIEIENPTEKIVISLE